MGWDVPVVGHPALMAPPVRPLLNKPEYWENAFAAGYVSTTYDANGKLPRAHPGTDGQDAAQAGRQGDRLHVLVGGDGLRLREDHRARGEDGRLDRSRGRSRRRSKNTKGSDGVYATLHLEGRSNRNGFPDSNMVVNIANTFKDGSFKLAPDERMRGRLTYPACTNATALRHD